MERFILLFLKRFELYKKISVYFVRMLIELRKGEFNGTVFIAVADADEMFNDVKSYLSNIYLQS